MQVARIISAIMDEIAENEKAICVIDLDTTMAGYFMSDVGDMCRTCLCSVSEEEKDLNLIKVKAVNKSGTSSGFSTSTISPVSGFCILWQ